MKVYIRVKKELSEEYIKNAQFSVFTGEDDSASYSPFAEIVTLVATIIGAGGLTKILIELINKSSKKVTAKADFFGNIEIDATNCSEREINNIIKALKERSNQEPEE